MRRWRTFIVTFLASHTSSARMFAAAFAPAVLRAESRECPATERTETSDEELVRSARMGDDHAFETLVRRHKRRVFRTASRFAHDDHQLDDLAQDIFVRVFKKLAQFRHDAPFEHWLARITISACYDFLRKERRTRAQVALETVDYDLSDTSVERAVSAGRARELIGWAMCQLTAEEQLILTLCELEERPMKEVAELTGWTESNVKVRAFRARNTLRNILKDHHDS
jgi:RNA polymerase sigma-70 factor (ECF subfamily)